MDGHSDDNVAKRCYVIAGLYRGSTMCRTWRHSLMNFGCFDACLSEPLWRRGTTYGVVPSFGPWIGTAWC